MRWHVTALLLIVPLSGCTRLVDLSPERVAFGPDDTLSPTEAALQANDPGLIYGDGVAVEELRTRSGERFEDRMGRLFRLPGDSLVFYGKTPGRPLPRSKAIDPTTVRDTLYGRFATEEVVVLRLRRANVPLSILGGAVLVGAAVGAREIALNWDGF